MKTNSSKLKSELKNSNHPFNTLSDAQQWIESVEKFGEKYDLKRMENACKMLNHPEKSFKSVHIGGTNGKGSTLQYIHQSLLLSNIKVGTFTSPYIVHFNERITLNGEMINDEDLLFYINQIYQLQDEYKKIYHDQITFFELVTLISFLYFKDKKVDIVLYEVGLGGRLDATNVIEPILSIIVSIGYDHMNVLGNSLKSIAENKLGIVKRNTPLVSGITQKRLYKQFKAHCDAKNAELYLTNEYSVENVNFSTLTTFNYKGEAYTLSMQGMHQINNAKVALKALEVLKNIGYTIPKKAIKKGLKQASMPGRFEHVGGAILDGAHNINGLESALKTLNTLYPKHNKTIIFTVMADKEYKPMLKLLEQHADKVVFSEIPYFRSEKADVLYESINHSNKYQEPNYLNALNYIENDQSNITLITGSLYFISLVRKALS